MITQFETEFGAPLHPLIQPWSVRAPSGFHPAIRHIKNINQKVSMPWPAAARLKRKIKKATISYLRNLSEKEAIDKIARLPKLRTLPEPITNQSKHWSESKHLLNAARSNIATASSTTYGCLSHLTDDQFRFMTCRERTEKDAAYLEHNEFSDNPKLLKFLCAEGRITKKDYQRQSQ